MAVLSASGILAHSASTFPDQDVINQLIAALASVIQSKRPGKQQTTDPGSATCPGRVRWGWLVDSINMGVELGASTGRHWPFKAMKPACSSLVLKPDYSMALAITSEVTLASDDIRWALWFNRFCRFLRSLASETPYQLSAGDLSGRLANCRSADWGISWDFIFAEQIMAWTSKISSGGGVVK